VICEVQVDQIFEAECLKLKNFIDIEYNCYLLQNVAITINWNTIQTFLSAMLAKTQIK